MLRRRLNTWNGAWNAGEIKALGNGRFNLPQEWAKAHQIDVGDFIYLIATSEGIMLCAKNMELL